MYFCASSPDKNLAQTVRFERGSTDKNASLNGEAYGVIAVI
jgi:hypothetical protein